MGLESQIDLDKKQIRKDICCETIYILEILEELGRDVLLSPLLSSLYRNDLVDYLENEGAAGVELWDLKLCALLYADGLILLVENENDLKKQMLALGNYVN